jgi:hypothetical protein
MLQRVRIAAESCRELAEDLAPKLAIFLVCQQALLIQV